MPRRALLALVLGAAAAAVCVRLGIWQMDRLAQRRAVNDAIAARWSATPVPIAALPGDTSLSRYRRVRIEGTFDFDNEQVLVARSRHGSPGVHILTPLRPEGSRRAVLVNRGWVYSPDAATVDLARWRESARTAVVGYVQTFSSAGEGDPQAGRPGAWRRLDGTAIARSLPYPIEPVYVVALEGERRAARAPPGSAASGADARPARLPELEISDGPHRSYAVQWFSFAAIAVVGSGVLAWQETRRRRGSSHTMG